MFGTCAGPYIAQLRLQPRPGLRPQCELCMLRVKIDKIYVAEVLRRSNQLWMWHWYEAPPPVIVFTCHWAMVIHLYTYVNVYIYICEYIYTYIHTSFHLSKFQMFWIATGEHNLVHYLVGLLPSSAILATSAIWRSQSWFTSGFEGYTPPKRHVLLVILGFVPLDTGCTSDFSWSLPLYGVRFTSLSGRLWTVAPWIITPSN